MTPSSLPGFALAALSRCGGEKVPALLDATRGVCVPEVEEGPGRAPVALAAARGTRGPATYLLRT